MSGAGTTTWELLCLGVPSVLVPLVDNQQPVADAIERFDLAEVVRPTASTDLRAAVTRLAGDADRRADLSARGRQLIDGAGARRVTAHLRSLLLKARPAALDDAKRLVGVGQRSRRPRPFVQL